MERAVDKMALGQDLTHQHHSTNASCTYSSSQLTAPLNNI
jgi:hypothetical protein